MINKILNYISISDGVMLVFFKDNSSITIDLKSGTRWGHNKDGSKMHDLPQWSFEHITIK